MRIRATLAFAGLLALMTVSVNARDPKDPTWWDKFQYVSNGGALGTASATSSIAFGSNVDVSNECGPQSETYIAARDGKVLAGGSNEIFRLPMRAYFSSDGGKTWGGSDLPLPPPQSPSGINFGSDPSLAFDTKGTLFYSYIVVDFSKGFSAINGTQLAVARSTDGGRTWPDAAATFFFFSGGKNHFNDKPMITTDRNPTSPFRDRIYVAWDAASGGSPTGGGILVATSENGGDGYSVVRADDPHGAGRSIGAVPFVGPSGELYVAWNDFAKNTIAFAASFDGGATFSPQSVISSKVIPFDIRIPAEFNRGALIYPACDADRSSGPSRGRLYCSWVDLNSDGVTTGIFLSTSDNAGLTWTPARSVGDFLPVVDRFNQWLAVDAVTGQLVIAFYDTRNDTTGQRFGTDFYLARSDDGGATFAPDIRVSNFTSNEHDCGGVFPCRGINYGNQQGDYAGVASYGGVAHPLWVDSRANLDPAPGCSRGIKMEEVFTATVR